MEIQNGHETLIGHIHTVWDLNSARLTLGLSAAVGVAVDQWLNDHQEQHDVPPAAPTRRWHSIDD